MLWIRNNISICVAALLSVALHVFVLFPALGIIGSGGERADGVATSLRNSDAQSPREREQAARDAQMQRKASSARAALQEQRDRERELTPKELEQRREEDEALMVKLGIDESDATTMNWIGYAEYEQHLAELAEVEQAAFRLQVASGSHGTADSSLPPSEPAPTVATSPNPSLLPLPAAAPGSLALAPSNLVTQPAPEPASTTPATPPTDSALARGNAVETARPLPPAQPPDAGARNPDSPLSTSQLPPTDPSEDGAHEASRPTDDTRRDPSTSDPAATTTPPETQTHPADGTKPVPPAADPSATDPASEPRVDPNADSNPSKVEPTKVLDAAPTGTTPDALPRDTSTSDANSQTPPIEAPTAAAPLNPNPATTTPVATPTADNAVSTATGAQGGGVDGPTPIDGAQSSPSLPSPAGAPGDTTASSGALSDRESDPTSIIDVPMSHWQNGKPLAAKGITLKPARPRFTTLNYVDGIGRNPIGELVLGRDGIPQIARVVRSTGNSGIDEAIRSALFKWRASGKQLEKLKPGQTLTIRLRIIMLQD